MIRLWLALTLVSCTLYGKDVPTLRGRVNDTAGLLTTQGVQRLEWALEGHEKRTSNQIAVLTIESLEGETIEAFSLKVAEQWKLGQKGKDNGVLLLVAKGDRKMRIEVGYGLEGTLTDVLCNRIIRGEMAPRFRSQDFEGGIETAVARMVGILEGSSVALPDTGTSEAIDTSSVGAFCRSGPKPPLEFRLLFGAISLPIILIFWIVGVTQGVWFLYLFLIPFCSAFPAIALGICGGAAVLVGHIFLFPIAALYCRRFHKGKSFAERMMGTLATQIRASARSGRSSSSSSWSSSSSRSSSSSSSSSFSGGGGSFGGGGSSGSW